MTAPDPTATCSVCRVPAQPAPLTWYRQQDGDTERWLCERCTRDNLRSIEARLDEPWW